MRIGITSQGKELTSKIDPRFGRAQYFIIYDTGDDSVEVLDNTRAQQMAHGAGTQAAQDVISKKVNLVVSGNFGPKAGEVLSAANIELAVLPDGTVADAIEQAKNDSLTPIGKIDFRQPNM